MSLMNNTFPHKKYFLIFFHTFFLFLFPFPNPKRLPSPLVSLHDLSLSLYPLPNGSFKILPSNQWPFHPSKANKNWEWFALQLILRREFLGPMRHKKNIPSSNQIGWQSSWLMGLEDSSFPLSWISWRGSWASSLSFLSVDPHILLLHPNYFK